MDAPWFAAFFAARACDWTPSVFRYTDRDIADATGRSVADVRRWLASMRRFGPTKRRRRLHKLLRARRGEM